MSLFKSDKKSGGNYLTGKEIRAIAKENAKVMKRLEAYKYRKAEESEFLTEMHDSKNILEIDNLHTYFFTEQGVVKAVNGVSFNIAGDDHLQRGDFSLHAGVHLTPGRA